MCLEEIETVAGAVISVVCPTKKLLTGPCIIIESSRKLNPQETTINYSLMKKTNTSYLSLITIVSVLIAGSNLANAMLLDINFGAHLNPGNLGATKTGYAAIGESSGDFWNFYSRDNTSAFDWKVNGALTNLKLANGTVTSIGLTVFNLPGAWANGSSDPMYNSYLYPHSGISASLSLTNLPAGIYDLLAYSQDGNYGLTVGANNYGIKTSYDNSPGGIPVWQEGRQYVRYSNISVGAGQSLNLSMQQGLFDSALISGLQLMQVPEPTSFSLIALAGFLFSAGFKRNKR